MFVGIFFKKFLIGLEPSEPEVVVVQCSQRVEPDADVGQINSKSN